jgi:signal transduction histidine kinase
MKEVWVDSHSLFSGTPDSAKVSEYEQESLKKDEEILKKAAEQKIDYKAISKKDRKKMAMSIDENIKFLLKEKEKLQNENATPEAIESKNRVIIILEKDKEIVTLSEESLKLKEEAELLAEEKARIKRYFISGGGIFMIIILVFFVYMQKRKIKNQDKEIEAQFKAIAKKNIYLEQAASLIRHDMHSGINTYMPRGLNTLETKLPKEKVELFKIGNSLKMIREGLSHTQKVYKKVYEFTNLVKKNQVLEKEDKHLKELVEEYLKSIGFKENVVIEDLGIEPVNPILFCFAMDNLVKNGIKYNDNETKWVKIYREDSDIIVEDNGKGMDQKKLEEILNAYRNQDSEVGLGLNISSAILNEHGFDLSCELTGQGTKIKIKKK